MKKRHEQKLVMLSISMLLVFNAPLIFLFEGEKVFFGIPVIYFSIFSIWLFSVLISYYVLNKYYE